ncbi:hypothetical protein [Polyangium mundeleinium]|uniref:Lipoprotein n=1 Tax=Polyangium mundeleinium TaxID=2995306 RepID=A0ABT5EJZ7_9BACT|nr:hypothetical protein [Polyangium mundeleinium]MDC0742101.1 hypothetical protein [Polyangium mundeleinium]
MRAFSPRVRTLVSGGLLACATTALVPLGCGATVRQLAQQDDRPRVPVATAERLRECVDEFGGDLSGGYYTFDVAVKVDEDGRVIDVASKGVAHADLTGCMRLALRGMTIPEDLLRMRKLRLSASPAPANGQTPAERGLVGNPALVVVAIALADLIIEAAPIVVVIAASVEIGKSEIAEAGRRKKETCSDQLGACLEKHPWNGPGEHRGASLCHACWKKCSNGKWPDMIPLGDELVSCKYPK